MSHFMTEKRCNNRDERKREIRQNLIEMTEGRIREKGKREGDRENRHCDKNVKYLLFAEFNARWLD